MKHATVIPFETQPLEESPEAAAGRSLKPLTTRTPSEILSMAFDPADLLLDNGYLMKGNSIAIVGAGGVGKSRLVMQLAVACVLGRQFVGWQTRAAGQKWLILQTENGNRRLQADLCGLLKGCTTEEMSKLDENLRIHTLENDDDSFVSLSNPETHLRIAAILKDFPANVIVYDVLRDFSTGDLNADQYMTETCSAIGRITRDGDHTRIPVVVHHALTGKAGASRATGFDRGSFGRNSKVLLGWTRAQINLAPFSGESNDVIVVASGKANDAEEFEPFAVRLDHETMNYERDDSVDIAEWRQAVAGEPASGSGATITHVVEAVRGVGLDGISKADIAKAVMKETACSRASAYRVITKAEKEKAILRRQTDKLYIIQP